MSIPGQTLTILDPGVAATAPTVTSPLFIGVSSSGTANVVQAYSSISSLVAALGQGPLVEAAAYKLQGGGPVYVCKTADTTAGVAGSVDKTAVDSSTGTITVSGEPADAYRGAVEIRSTGTLGSGTFRYTLERAVTSGEASTGQLREDPAGFTPSWSADITIPAGGTYVIANTGLTLTFVPGGGAVYFEDGDMHTFDCTEPAYTTGDLSTAMTAVLASSTQFAFPVFCGRQAADPATMAAAIGTHMTSLASAFRYHRGVLDGGNTDSATAATNLAAVSADTRLSLCYGPNNRVTTAKPITGWGTPLLPAIVPVAARYAEIALSTHPGRVASGALRGVSLISHDERTNETIDQLRVTTLRTYVGSSGYYITRGRLLGAATSDFTQWQYGRVVDTACNTVTTVLRAFQNAGIRALAGGTIDPRDASRIEAAVNKALQVALLEPYNDEGFKGHVSALAYTVDRTNTIVGEGNGPQGTLAIRPLGYAETITTTVGLTSGAVSAEEA